MCLGDDFLLKVFVVHWADGCLVMRERVAFVLKNHKSIVFSHGFELIVL